MRGALRSRVAAAAVFLLIAVVVLGGMTWATISSFDLAKWNVTEKRQHAISRAVWEMSSYMGGILNSEGARAPEDYVAFHWRRPVAVFSDSHAQLDTSRVAVVLESPLAILGPPHDWIDLYFQLDTEGVVSSPQVHDDTPASPFENSQVFWRPDSRALDTWEWVKSVLPGLDLREQTAPFCRTHECLTTDPSEARLAQEATETQEDELATGEAGSRLREVYQQRRQSLHSSQVSYLPPSACVDAEIAERNVGVTDPSAGDLNEAAPQFAEDVEISMDPIATFWLGEGPDGRRKLGFVRACHADATVFYQGFIGDWTRLKPVLLGQIAGLLPEVDLEPVTDEMGPGLEAGVSQMINLPVQLRVPGIPGGVSAAAWHRIRVPLIAAWAAAAAVMVVAGWGLGNLVALTERRMQFAYAVTHELRTPLTTFRLYSDMLAGGMVPEGSKKEYLDTLNHEAIRLSSLVEEVLEYARLESHRVKLNATETDGPSLLRTISETLDRRCKDNGIEARAENLIAEADPLRTDVDVVNRIASVLVNNACRHARGSTGAATVVQLSSQDGELRLDVIDTGPGIRRSDARAIFRPFRRGRGADKAAQGGIGLGLALARSWANLLGGHLELVARQDPRYGGAHFRLSVPARIHG